MLEPLQVALRDVKADEAELWAHRRRSAITRYAKNEIHQNALADETYVQARVAVRGAVGIASGNSLEPSELRRLIAAARAAADLSVPNADWPGLASPAPVHDATSFDASTAEANAKYQADVVHLIAEIPPVLPHVRGGIPQCDNQRNLSNMPPPNRLNAARHPPPPHPCYWLLVTGYLWGFGRRRGFRIGSFLRRSYVGSASADASHRIPG